MRTTATLLVFTALLIGGCSEPDRPSIPLYLAVVSGYLMSNEFEDTPIESIEVRRLEY